MRARHAPRGIRTPDFPLPKRMYACPVGARAACARARPNARTLSLLRASRRSRTTTTAVLTRRCRAVDTLPLSQKDSASSRSSGSLPPRYLRTVRTCVCFFRQGAAQRRNKPSAPHKSGKRHQQRPRWANPRLRTGSGCSFEAATFVCTLSPSGYGAEPAPLSLRASPRSRFHCLRVCPSTTEAHASGGTRTRTSRETSSIVCMLRASGRGAKTTVTSSSPSPTGEAGAYWERGQGGEGGT